MRKNIISCIIIIVLVLLIIGFSFFIYKYWPSKDKKPIKEKVIETIKTEEEEKETLEDRINKCLITALPDEKITDSLKEKIDSLNKLFSKNSLNISYYYYDINSGYTLSYNEDKETWAASVIKAPVALYIYNLASKGDIDLEETLTYTSAYYAEGTGKIRYQKYNTKYTIRTLVEYAIKYSDNIAHRMLVKRFGMDNIKAFWKERGSIAIFENNKMFSNFTAKDGFLVMKELYDFSTENEYGKELMGYFKEAKTNFVTGNKGDEIAHKYGWGQSSLHDMAIIFDENPYILTVFTNRGQTSYASFFKDVSSKVNDIHKEYNDLKNNYCNSIE
jgi:hypothetical protein